MKPSDESESLHNAEAILNPHSSHEPDWQPATQPDSVIGFDTQTGQPLTKAEVFPDAVNPTSPLPELEPVEGQTVRTEPKTALEHLQADGQVVEELDLDQDPRQYEPDDGPGGWQGQKPQMYKGDLKG